MKFKNKCLRLIRVLSIISCVSCIFGCKKSNDAIIEETSEKTSITLTTKNYKRYISSQTMTTKLDNTGYVIYNAIFTGIKDYVYEDCSILCRFYFSDTYCSEKYKVNLSLDGNGETGTYNARVKSGQWIYELQILSVRGEVYPREEV